jgi:RimJ/RimL family protein N-acetyltransferase
MKLREVLEADLLVLFEQQRDPEAVQMAHFPPREHDAFFAHWRTNVLGNSSNLARVIEVDGEVAGYVASWQPREGAREVGYWLGRAYWGRGIASAALAAFLSADERTRPLVACVVAHNTASRRVLEKSGFVAIVEPVVAPDGVREVLFRLDA